MNLSKKKILAAQTLKVGKNRISFNKERIEEIKEAITKQDMRDLFQSKAIIINEIKGKRKQKKRKTRRKAGSIRKKVKTRKRDYLTLTRKLRAYLSELRKQGKISNETFSNLRKEIKSKNFRSKAQLKEKIANEENTA